MVRPGMLNHKLLCIILWTMSRQPLGTVDKRHTSCG